MTPSEISIADLDRLMTRVNAVEVMSNDEQRSAVLIELRRVHGNQFDPARFQGSSTDNWSIVRACIERDAMIDLSRMIKIVGGATAEWRDLESLIGQLFPVEGEGRRDVHDQLVEFLGATPSDIATGARSHEIVRSLEPEGGSELTEPVDIYRQLQDEPGQRGRRALLFILELVAHRLSDEQAVEIHWLIEELATRSTELDAVRGLCASLTSGDPSSVAVMEQQALDTRGPAEETDHQASEEGVVRTSSTPVAYREALLAAQPTVWGGVPPRNSSFTGREELLDDLRRLLTSHSTSALVPQPLHGLGGVGKSQVATEFAYRFQSDYDLVWWVQADDDRSVRRSLVSLGRRLGLPESEDVQDTVDTVLDALRRGDPHHSWLLIYDNAPEPGTVRPYLPSGVGNVIVTSRSRSWASESRAIEVDVFTPPESVALVRSRWKNLSEEAALELASRLGHLPLALEQAVSVHEQTGMPLSDYLRALDENPAEMLGEGIAGNYSTSIARTLSLGFENLEAVSPPAAQLLKLCVFLSSHPIAIPLLSAGRNADVPADLDRVLRSDIALRRAIRDLGRYALVQLDPGRDFLRVHSLVRAVLRDSLASEERVDIERSAHAVLAAANPKNPDSPSTWHLHAQIAPHVVPSGLIYSAQQEALRTVLDQVRYHYAIGDYAASKALGQEVLDVWRTGLGADDEFTLVLGRHLANAMRALGEYSAARDLDQYVLDRLRVTLGADHEHSLATANSVAADLRITGQFREALKLDTDNLDRHEKVLGPDDPGTIRVTTNLAVDHRLLGNFARARELDEANLERKISLYGQDHPRTLFSYTCLIRDLYGQGHYREGLALAQEKIPLYEQRLAPNHMDVLIARRHLAMLLRKAGYIGVAVVEADKAYAAHLQKFGPSHEHSLSALMTLMNCQRAANELDRAVRSGRQALNSYRALLTEDHPFTFACMVDLAITLRLHGELDEAQELNDEALTGLSRTLGDNHPYTLCGMHAVANGFAAAQRMEDARAMDERTLEQSRRTRGEDHPYTLACAINLALDLEAVGEEGPSNALRRSTLNRIRRVLGSDHPETANVGLYIRTESEIEVPAT